MLVTDQHFKNCAVNDITHDLKFGPWVMTS